MNLNAAYKIFDSSVEAKKILGDDIHHNFGIFYDYEYSVKL